jgi:hypothetical protein
VLDGSVVQFKLQFPGGREEYILPDPGYLGTLIVNLALHVLPHDRRQYSCLGKLRIAIRGYQIGYDYLGPPVHYDGTGQPVTEHNNRDQ